MSFLNYFSFWIFLSLFICSSQLTYALSPQTQFLEHGIRTEKKIALTFDACVKLSADAYDERITQILVETKTPATIFISGRWMERNTQHAKLLATYPQFEFGNHAFYHPHMAGMDPEKAKRELQRTQNAFHRVLGITPTLFRPPFGEYDENLIKTASALGLTTVQYDLPSGDPDPKITKEKLAKFVINHAKNGSIVVFHINKNGIHTSEALPEIISELNKKGFTFVKVSEFLSKHPTLQR